MIKVFDLFRNVLGGATTDLHTFFAFSCFIFVPKVFQLVFGFCSFDVLYSTVEQRVLELESFPA